MSVGRERKRRGLGAPDPAGTMWLGSAVLQVLLGLLIGLFGLRFRVGRRHERLDGMTKAHAATPCHGRFQSVEAAGDIEILRDVSSGHTLADCLESATGSRSIFACE